MLRETEVRIGKLRGHPFAGCFPYLLHFPCAGTRVIGNLSKVSRLQSLRFLGVSTGRQCGIALKLCENDLGGRRMSR